MKFPQTRYEKYGTPAGTLLHEGVEHNTTVEFNVFDFCLEGFTEHKYRSVAELPLNPKEGNTLWIDVNGNHDIKAMEQLGEKYGISPLILADAMSDNQRVKLDELEDAMFLVLKMIYRHSGNQEIIVEQVSFYLTNNILITFQEKNEDVYEPIRNRIRNAKGRIRRMKADYLFYALMDIIVDNYITVLEQLSDEISSLEEVIIKHHNRKNLGSVYEIKRKLLYLRKNIHPMREIMIRLQKDESGLIGAELSDYLKDLNDHVVQVSESIETYREVTASLIDLYVMLNSNAMNQVVKTLTIISTIFIPLTFIVGVYGMNFDFMPELRWHYGYFTVWAVMIILVMGMLFIFKKRKWM